MRVRTSVDFPEPESPMTTKTSPGQTSNDTLRTAATQPCFSRSSARPSSASGVPTTRSALRPKIFQTPPTRMSGLALRSMACPDDSPVSATVVTVGAYSALRRPPRLEEPHRATLGIDVDVGRRGRLSVARHRLHVAAERHDPAGPGVGAQIADGDREPARR